MALWKNFAVFCKVQPQGRRITLVATTSIPYFCCDLTYHLQPRSAPCFYVWSDNKEKYIPCPKNLLWALNKATGDVCWQGGNWILLHRYFEDTCHANTGMSVLLHVSAPGVWEQSFHNFWSVKTSQDVFEKTRMWSTGCQVNPAWENCLGLHTQVLPVISYATLHLVLWWLDTHTLLLGTSFYFRTWKSLFQW